MAFEDDQGRSERRKNPNPIVGDQGSPSTGTGFESAGSAAAGMQSDQDAYWRQRHSQQSFARNRPYEDYQAGYRAGYEGYSKCQGKRSFEESENDLRQEYERNRGKSGLEWEHARLAARAAWDRLGSQNSDRLIGFKVTDMADRKIGTVNNLWADETGQPAFLGMKTGWLGLGKNHVVPVHTAHVNDRDQVIRLPYSEDRIKEAPAFDADTDLTAQDQEEIYRYYGVQGAEYGQRRGTPEQAPRSSTARKSGEGTTMQLKEERVKVGKREVESGGVRLRKIVRTETVQQPVELQHEEIVIERVAGSGAAVSGEGFKEETIFIPLRREEPVIEKETRVREEVRVGKKREAERRTVSESVRKEDVEVENQQNPRFGGQGESGRGSERYTPKERSRDH
jgi:uncharacterized protein (TIGR02271 family)